MQDSDSQQEKTAARAKYLYPSSTAFNDHDKNNDNHKEN
jgi:hypothetical protein